MGGGGIDPRRDSVHWLRQRAQSADSSGKRIWDEAAPLCISFDGGQLVHLD
jgi:hypothetical protein